MDRQKIAAGVAGLAVVAGGAVALDHAIDNDRDDEVTSDTSGAEEGSRALAYTGPATAGAEEGSAALAYTGPATAGAEEGSAALAYTGPATAGAEEGSRALA